MAQRFTKEELQAAIQEGNRTYAALGRKFDLTAKNIKIAMEKLGVTLEENEAAAEPVQETTIINPSAQEHWDDLYKEYEYHQQAQYLIAECKTKGMSVTQTRIWMKQNFSFNDIQFEWPTFREAQIKTRLDRIARIEAATNRRCNYPWAQQAKEEARKLGLLVEEEEPTQPDNFNVTSVQPYFDVASIQIN